MTGGQLYAGMREGVLEIAACGNSRSKRSKAALHGVCVEERSKS